MEERGCGSSILNTSGIKINFMYKFYPLPAFFLFAFVLIHTSCNGQQKKPQKTTSAVASKSTVNYKEGTDYLLFERVRMLDKTGFSQPQEAYSLLLPKGWQQQGEIIWIGPGQYCAGTHSRMRATSPDKKYSFDMLPHVIYSWNANQQNMQPSQNTGSSSFCREGRPMNAEEYLRNVFAPNELQNPEIIKVEPNNFVVQMMQQSNEKTRAELMQYGSAQIQYYQTAINATVRWKNGTEGLVVLGINISENTVPNKYNGTYTKIYVTQALNRIVFTYPEADRTHAADMFSLIMASVRTNPSWSTSVNTFWKNVRQQSNVTHIGRIQMIDAQTDAMGKAAIKKGAERSQAMDMEARNWEQRQSANDRMHTNFIKTIRGVENYQDATGKIELTSGYDHAWSRGDGSSFIMSNNPNFNPGSVLQDQRWAEMKKVD